jgi:hypothetical protein
MEKVQVAGGGELLTGAHVTPMEYSVQGHTFHNSFKVLQLKDYDIVLGGDWMLAHNPVKFDYHSRKVKINHNGQQKIHLQDNSLKHGVPLMSIHKLQKELKKGATGYYLFPITATPSSDSQPASAAIDQLLTEYADVFKEPTGLPPP